VFCWDFDPGTVVTTATSQPAAAASASRASIPRWRDPFGLTGERQAEHILERGEPVATPGQQGADRGVGQVGR
jgi:hypothetical protein